MFKTSKKGVATAILAAGLGVCVGQANAIPTLTISDSATLTTITVVDGGAGDLCGLAGCVIFAGSVGTWTLVSATGFTQPLLGAFDEPHLDIGFNVIKIAGSSATTLDILWSDIGFSTSTPVASVSDIGGTKAQGTTSVAYADFASAANTINATDEALCAGSFNTSAFSQSCSDVINVAAPYSLTMRISVTATSGAAQASGDHSLQVPEPATLALIGLGLVGLGFARRKQA